MYVFSVKYVEQRMRIGILKENTRVCVHFSDIPFSKGLQNMPQDTEISSYPQISPPPKKFFKRDLNFN